MEDAVDDVRRCRQYCRLYRPVYLSQDFHLLAITCLYGFAFPYGETTAGPGMAAVVLAAHHPLMSWMLVVKYMITAMGHTTAITPVGGDSNVRVLIVT